MSDDDAPAKKRRGSGDSSSAPRKRARSKLPPPPTNTQATVRRHWTPEEDNALRAAMAEIVPHRWKLIAERVPGRDHIQCLQRWQKVLDPKLIKVRDARTDACNNPIFPRTSISSFPVSTSHAQTCPLFTVVHALPTVCAFALSTRPLGCSFYPTVLLLFFSLCCTFAGLLV